MKIWFIGFFRYEDSKIWNRTSLFEKEDVLAEYMKKMDYIDQTKVVIKAIELPE